MDDLHVVVTDHLSDPRWEPFVASHPGGTVYHHPAWLRVLERSYGYKPLSLACQDGQGRLRGVMPLFATHGLITGRGLASLPRTPVAGPLAVDGLALAALMRAAMERVRAERGAMLQVRVASTELDGLDDQLVGAPWELTYTLDLPSDITALRFGNGRNHRRIKSAVRKSEQLGVRVRPAESVSELRAWYELYLDAMRSHVALPRPYRFFKACWDELQPRGLMRLLLAEQFEAGRTRLLAGSLLLMYGGTVYYAYNGRRRDALWLHPNDALQWHALQDACRAGFRRYDFGAVPNANRGLAYFKTKWGAEAMRTYKYSFPGRRKAEPGEVPMGGRTRKAVNAAWRRLPLHLTALVGDWMYSYL